MVPSNCRTKRPHKGPIDFLAEKITALFVKHAKRPGKYPDGGNLYLQVRKSTEAGAFMLQLCEDTGVAARALELLILTAARTNEAIRAEWSEFDLDRRIWVVPAERMKSERSHRVPLSAAAGDTEPPLYRDDVITI